MVKNTDGTIRIMVHLSFFLFTTALIGERAFQETRRTKIERDDDLEPTPLKCQKLNDRITKIVNSYEKSDVFDVVHYLTASARSFVNVSNFSIIYIHSV